MRKIILLAFIFFSIVTFGFIISWGSIINDQYGYAEIAWHVAHIDFWGNLLSPAITPFNYILSAGMTKILNISITNVLKLIDLFFGGLLAVFLTYIYWKYQKANSLRDLLIPIFLLLTSLGFIYPLTAAAGEGSTVFFAIVGIYLWQKKSFVKASLFFIFSFLSKYTLFLIAPAIFLWTIFNWRSLPKKSQTRIAIAVSILLLAIVSYYLIKSPQEVLFQSQDSTSSSFNNLIVNKILPNSTRFIFALFIGIPIASFFALFYPDWKDLAWVSAISSLIILITRRFLWHYPYEIIPFLLLYLFTHPKAKQFLKTKVIFLQILLSGIIVFNTPMKINGTTIIPKHPTKYDSFAIENEIRKDYKGGRIGFYGSSVRLDFPFPSYNIRFLNEYNDFVIEDSEYVVIPLNIGMPIQLTQNKNCQFVFHKNVGTSILYKTICKQKRGN